MVQSSRATALLFLLLLLLLSSLSTSTNNAVAASSCLSPRRSLLATTTTLPRSGGQTKTTATKTSNSSIISTSSSSSSSSSSSALVDGLKSTLASGLAAACAKTILAPFDTIKTVQQNVQGTNSLGILDAISIITARSPGGVRNLYAGLTVSALGSMPSVGLYFGVYSYCKRTICPKLLLCFGSGSASSNQQQQQQQEQQQCISDTTLRNFGIALSAAIGNTVASFSRVPYEVVKQSLQTGQYSTTFQAITTMWNKNGQLRAFFPLGGISIQMVRDIPYAVFTLLSYEYIREHWVNKQSQLQLQLGDEEDKYRWLRDMIAGATAGGIGTYLTNPFDVIKTRLQTTTSTSAGGIGGGGASIYGGSIIKCAMAIYNEGGSWAFLRGSIPRLMHKIPANGFFFVFYEFFKRVLNVE
jgi:hypothetical protein